MRIKRYTLTLVISMLGLATVALGQNAQQVISRMQSKYQSMRGLEGDFTQTMRSSYGGGNSSLSGRIYLQPAGANARYRIEMDDQTIVTDGQTTWVYSRQENQVMITESVDDETTFQPSTFFVSHPNKYNIQKLSDRNLNGSGHFVLRLTPRGNDSFTKEIKLSIRKSDYVPTQIQIVDLNDTTVIFTLNNFRVVNGFTRNNLFRLATPGGAEVIDLRS